MFWRPGVRNISEIDARDPRLSLARSTCADGIKEGLVAFAYVAVVFYTARASV